MTSLRTAVFAFLGALAAGCSPDPPVSELTKQVDGYFAPLVDQREFSGVVMVARGKEVLVERAYGMADFERGIAHERGDSFSIASLSKTFTAAAIEILSGRNELSLNDPLSAHVADFPRGDEITLEMLLLHQSGVAEEHQFPDFTDRRYDAVSLADQVARIAAQPLQFQPGSDSAYSNSGYVILARVVELVSKRSFEDFLKTEIFLPLDLGQTAIDWADGVATPGYVPGLPPSMVEHEPRQAHASHAIGASEIRSTAADMVTWLRTVDAGTPVNVFALDYPYGWGSREYFGRRAIEQSGITGGFISAMALFPDEDLYVIVLSNIRAGRPQSRAHIDLAGLALGEGVEPLYLPTLALDTERDLSRAVGRYDFPGIGVIAVREAAGVLEFEWEGFALSSYLYPLEDGHYWNRLDGAEIAFDATAERGASTLIWSPGEGEVRAPRLADR